MENPLQSNFCLVLIGRLWVLIVNYKFKAKLVGHDLLFFQLEFYAGGDCEASLSGWGIWLLLWWCVCICISYGCVCFLLWLCYFGLIRGWIWSGGRAFSDLFISIKWRNVWPMFHWEVFIGPAFFTERIFECAYICKFTDHTLLDRRKREDCLVHNPYMLVSWTSTDISGKGTWFCFFFVFLRKIKKCQVPHHLIFRQHRAVYFYIYYRLLREIEKRKK